MIKFRIISGDHGSDNTSAIQFSTDVSIRNFLASTEETITVPAGTRFAIFQSDVAKLWVGTGTTPITVPSGDLDSQSIALNPDVRFLSGVTTIRIISDTAGEAVVSFYG